MAARRLVVVMLVLLAISTIAAALVPAPDQREADPGGATGKTARDSPPARGSPMGKLTEGRIDTATGTPAQIRIERGDQLRLAVTARSGDDIEIPGFGLLEPVDPFAPATFDVLAVRRGSFAVRAVEADRVLGSIVVGGPGSGRCGVSIPGARRGRAPAPECDPPGTPASKVGGRSARQP